MTDRGLNKVGREDFEYAIKAGTFVMPIDEVTEKPLVLESFDGTYVGFVRVCARLDAHHVLHPYTHTIRDVFLCLSSQLMSDLAVSSMDQVKVRVDGLDVMHIQRCVPHGPSNNTTLVFDLTGRPRYTHPPRRQTGQM